MHHPLLARGVIRASTSSLRALQLISPAAYCIFEMNEKTLYKDEDVLLWDIFIDLERFAFFNITRFLFCAPNAGAHLCE
jgi:hypothetical protein